MVHSNVWKFAKIWLNGTLIIIRKPKVWRTNRHEDPYIPPTLVERGYNNDRCELMCSGSVFSFCSIGNRRVALVRNPEISHAWEKDEILTKYWLAIYKLFGILKNIKIHKLVRLDMYTTHTHCPPSVLVYANTSTYILRQKFDLPDIVGLGWWILVN